VDWSLHLKSAVTALDETHQLGSAWFESALMKRIMTGWTSITRSHMQGMLSRLAAAICCFLPSCANAVRIEARGFQVMSIGYFRTEKATIRPHLFEFDLRG